MYYWEVVNNEKNPSRIDLVYICFSNWIQREPFDTIEPLPPFITHSFAISAINPLKMWNSRPWPFCACWNDGSPIFTFFKGMNCAWISSQKGDLKIQIVCWMRLYIYKHTHVSSNVRHEAEQKAPHVQTCIDPRDQGTHLAYLNIRYPLIKMYIN